MELLTLGFWNFTKGECHYTDVTNASRTMLYNINEDCWDDELVNIFNINKNILPDVKNCVDDFGTIDPVSLEKNFNRWSSR